MFTELPTPLGERVEFASAAWLEEVERFLSERASDLPEETFAFSTRLDHPPPHLHPGTSPFGYTVRLRRGEVAVSPTPSEAVDRYRRADYNAALPFAWTVIGNDDAVRERAQREYRQLAGGGYPPPRGHPPSDPALRQTLAALHDHMARRTINNPDVEHRIEHFGLEGNVAELAERGYTILANAFSPAFADELRIETHRNHAANPPDAGFRATMLLRRGRIWEEAAVHPWVLALAEHLLGRGCLMYQSDTIVKGPGLDTHPGLHSDYAASMVAEPFPEFCLEATAVWAIDDFIGDAGPTCVLPGSHRKGRQVPPGTTQEGTATLEMPSGSIAFWHGALWHGSTPRKAPGKRTSLHNAYSRNFVRPVERYENIDADILNRNPALFATLCGLDDAFGKSGESGADFNRLGYAARAGYGRTALPREVARFG